MQPFALSPSQRRWVLITLITLTAAALRFLHLEQLPPGLYRDEAFNGLDALSVLNGNTPLYFDGNNGREPLHIYLTALSIAVFGQSVWAIRFSAAVIGTITTVIIYKWSAEWFNERVGLLTAWLWAVTVWPIHLSRLGFRVVTIIPFLTFTAWVGTVAYRKQSPKWWVLTGIAYGISFYTYLAVRFTPALVVLFVAYLWWRNRHQPLIKGLPFFAIGLTMALLPLMWVIWQSPDLFLGRTGQVSILNPNINNGNLFGTLLHHIGRSLGLFFWAGDTIIRHNPSGRPLFDVAMAVPFFIGLGWCVQQWRKPAAAGALLWAAIMLGPTILAEDAPHFLRAVGILPATLIFPAIGLSWLSSWPKLVGSWKVVVVPLILVTSLIFSLNDYFVQYATAADTGYLFEAAARDLVTSINEESTTTTVIWDETRFLDNWPSVQFLLSPNRPLYSHTDDPHLDHLISLPTSWYLWPFEADKLAQAIQHVTTPAQISSEVGSLARGDLEPEAYPFYIRYIATTPTINLSNVAASFNNQYKLHASSVEISEGQTTLTVNLYWSSPTSAANRSPTTVFVHVLDTESGMLSGQSDNIPGNGYLPTEWWSADVIMHDQHIIELAQPYDLNRHHIFVGLYPNGSPNERLLVIDDNGQTSSDAWRITP